MNDKTAELKKVCKEIFKDMAQKNTELGEKSYGFHFTYSPEKSWRPDTKVLLLTINPQSKDVRTNQDTPFVPETPWPKDNDFFRPNNKFDIKNRILTILAEIASHKLGQKVGAACENETLKNFVNDNVVLASYVPFRTRSTGKDSLTQEMMDFAQEKYWSKILNIWHPELIIATGNIPFDNLIGFYQRMQWSVPKPIRKEIYEYHTQDIFPLSSGHYSSCHCTHPSGKATHILGVPHPSAHFPRRRKATDTKIWGSNYGYPDPKHYPSDEAPIQKFLREQLNNIDF